jgi:NAD-dependent dihydropyrimidine dehydrogenase PreA subunit
MFRAFFKAKTMPKEKQYQGIPRNQIPWAPKIDYTKCTTCGKCVDFCHTKAFATTEENGKTKTIVKDPNACVVFCHGCETICPAGAITHPSDEETQRLIEKLKKDKQ